MNVQRQVVDRVAWMAVGALVVLYVLVPERDSLLSDVVGSAADMPAVFRWALVVAGTSAFLAGVLGIHRLLRERRRSVRR